MSIDYKTKYLDIRKKLLSATDVAYRCAFEEGLRKGAQQAQMEQMQMQIEQMAQQQMAQQQAMMGGGAPGAEGEAPPQEEMSPEEQQAMEEQGMAPEGEAEQEMPPEQSSELDAGIAELEGLVSKGEKPKVRDIRKVVDRLSDIRKAARIKNDNKAKQNNNAQTQFVKNIINKWEKDTKKEYSDIDNLIQEYNDTEKK